MLVLELIQALRLRPLFAHTVLRPVSKVLLLLRLKSGAPLRFEGPLTVFFLMESPNEADGRRQPERRMKIMSNKTKEGHRRLCVGRQGCNLQQRMESNNRIFPETEAAFILGDVLSALRYLHRCVVCLGELRPFSVPRDHNAFACSFEMACRGTMPPFAAGGKKSSALGQQVPYRLLLKSFQAAHSSNPCQPQIRLNG